ncbi:MAG: hypothetical protein Q7U99_12190 [Rubrivivax sp.]|nr:hypothetical protein [Rubrivivax sp.]
MSTADLVEARPHNHLPPYGTKREPSPVRLEVNRTGLWAAVCDFDAHDAIAEAAVCEAVQLLAAEFSARTRRVHGPVALGDGRRGMSNLDQEWQQNTASSAAHAALMVQASIQAAAARYEAPSAVYRPRLSIDGDQWCALYGDNLQDGVAGFGKSPADAMWNFDQAWTRRLTANVRAEPDPTASTN